MFKNYLVHVPQIKGRIYKKLTKHKDGTADYYIEYELERTYNKERKNTSTKRTTIGKQCHDKPELMYPNDNYYKLIPDAEYPAAAEKVQRSSCLKAGAYIAFRKIVKEYGLDQILNESIGKKKTGLFLDFCSYTIQSEDNAGQYYPDYAYNHPLFTTNMRVYSDSALSDFLSSLTPDQRIEVLKRWVSTRGKQEKIYLSYDSTNKLSEAGDLEMVEEGKSKSGLSSPIFNYSLVFDHNNREPLLYERYPGSINDVSQLQFVLEKLYGYGYKNICIILDRGYFSKPNIHYMDEHGISFIMMVKGNKTLVNKLILEHKNTFEEKYANHIERFDVNGTTVESCLYESDRFQRYFHLYYSPERYSAERAKLMEKIRKMEKALKEAQGTEMIFPSEFHHYFTLYYKEETRKIKEKVISEKILQTYIPRTDVIDEETSLCGYFAIITSDKMSFKEAYLRYKGRDPIEKLFRSDKTFLGDRMMRVTSDESTDGKIFIEFIALIIRSKIYTTLMDEMIRIGSKPNFMTVPAAIKELNKIELIKTPDGVYRLDHAITATQKAILKAFGITSVEARAMLDQLGKQIAEYDRLLGKEKPQNPEAESAALGL
ncbi:MAG: transposase [Erysipelotrichaceae bacterium]|nr:transposase [Erysipelotrichaceae bacterium]